MSDIDADRQARAEFEADREARQAQAPPGRTRPVSRAEAMGEADRIGAETAYRLNLAREAFDRGREAGRTEGRAERDAGWAARREPSDPVMSARIQAAADADAAEMDRRRYPPGGRQSWMQPRVGDTYAAWAAHAEAEAG